MTRPGSRMGKVRSINRLPPKRQRKRRNERAREREARGPKCAECICQIKTPLECIEAPVNMLVEGPSPMKLDLRDSTARQTNVLAYYYPFGRKMAPFGGIIRGSSRNHFAAIPFPPMRDLTTHSDPPFKSAHVMHPTNDPLGQPKRVS